MMIVWLQAAHATPRYGATQSDICGFGSFQFFSSYLTKCLPVQVMPTSMPTSRSGLWFAIVVASCDKSVNFQSRITRRSHVRSARRTQSYLWLLSLNYPKRLRGSSPVQMQRLAPSLGRTFGLDKPWPLALLSSFSPPVADA